jgi:hypothetical protein
MSDDRPLIDDLYAQSFGKPVPEWRSNKLMRGALVSARRFILDGPMSSFLADITHATTNKRTRLISYKALEHVRRAARLPHAVTWIEFDQVQCVKREAELGFIQCDPPIHPDLRAREGWLLNDFNQDENEFRLHLFRRIVSPTRGLWYFTYPFGINWRTDDRPPHLLEEDFARHGESVLTGASVLLGINGKTGRIRVAPAELLTIPANWKEVGADVHHNAVGVMRRAWSLLAVVNDLPVLQTRTQTARGFTARAKRHPFLEHRTISLHVPQRSDMRTLARAVVAQAKRRAHQVRGHWRKDAYHPGNRIRIREHQRGDASLGFVTHDYQVLH